VVAAAAAVKDAAVEVAAAAGVLRPERMAHPKEWAAAVVWEAVEWEARP